MRVVLGSIFRNSTPYLDRYFAQVGALANELRERGDTLRPILAEGDSTDGTFEQLQERTTALQAEGVACELIQVSHGGPEYGSVDKAERWRNISRVCNALLDLVQPDDDMLIYVESDLIWEPATMLQLLHNASLTGVGVAVPMCFLDGTRQFYDIWGHRRNSLNFQPHAPFHPDLETWRGATLLGMDSAGSCLVMLADVARRSRFDPADQGIVGWCASIRSLGQGIWLDPSVTVVHPR